MFDLKLKKRVVINEEGTANIVCNVQFENKSNKRSAIYSLSIEEETSEMTDITVTDSDGNSLPFQKIVNGDFVSALIDFKKKKVKPYESYLFTIEYILPSLVKRFENAYFYKEMDICHKEAQTETMEVTVTCELPRLFSKYMFWKKMHVNAPQASRIYSSNGVKTIEYHRVLPKGTHREFSFMFQEQYNSKVVALLAFFLGIGINQFLEWLIGLLF